MKLYTIVDDPKKGEMVDYSEHTVEYFNETAKSWSVLHVDPEAMKEKFSEQDVRDLYFKRSNTELSTDSYVIKGGELVGIRIMVGCQSVHDGMGGWKPMREVIILFESYKNTWEKSCGYRYTSITRYSSEDYYTLLYYTGDLIKEAENGEFYIKDSVLLKRFNRNTSVVIPEGVKIIGKNVFRGDYIENITFPSTLEVIESGAFEYCRGLKSIVFPESLREIKNDAFYFCSDLKEIALPSSGVYLGEDAFAKCEKLSSVLYNREKTQFGRNNKRSCCFKKTDWNGDVDDDDYGYDCEVISPEDYYRDRN